MDAIEVAARLIDWASETCPELKGVYPLDPASKTQPLPDVAAVVTGEEWTDRDPETGERMDQFDFHVFEVRLMLMVAPNEEADETLKGFVRDLAASIRGDGTLGGSPFAVSPRLKSSYDPPFVKFEDGTEGRAADLFLLLAEAVPTT